MTVGVEIGAIPARGTKRPSKKIAGRTRRLKRRILAKILTGETGKGKMKGEVEAETVMPKRGTGNKKLIQREGKVNRGMTSHPNHKSPRILEQY
jgi:hypothetical protein